MIKTKRGGGPKTPEGKLASSKNSIKTGAYSRTVVLPGESEEEFQALLDQFIQDFSPRDIAEASIVRELAILTWKRLRLEQIANSEITRELYRPLSEYEWSVIGVKLPENSVWLFKELHLATPEYFQAYRKILKFINEIQSQSSITLEAIAQFPERCPDFVGRAFDLAEEYWHYDRTNTTWDNLAGFEYQEGGKLEPFVNIALKVLKTRARQVVNLSSKLEIIQNGVKALNEKRVFELMASDRRIRTSETLSREFFRTLGELRRQQKWRKDIGIVDISAVDEDEI